MPRCADRSVASCVHDLAVVAIQLFERHRRIGQIGGPADADQSNAVGLCVIADVAFGDVAKHGGDAADIDAHDVARHKLRRVDAERGRAFLGAFELEDRNPFGDLLFDAYIGPVGDSWPLTSSVMISLEPKRATGAGGWSSRAARVVPPVMMNAGRCICHVHTPASCPRGA